MNDRDAKKKSPETKSLETGGDVREFVLDGVKLNSISSPALKGESSVSNDSASDLPADGKLPPKIQNEPDLTKLEDDLSDLENPIFKELSEPRLPALPKENRARLQMQSPTRLHFYWSVKTNPFQTLNRAFNGKTGSYTLIIKLVNQKTGREELFPVDAEGSWWFDVDAEAAYRAEVGFYAPNRPFVRVMFSNTVETPRQNPSQNSDYSPDFIVSADQFAEVLDVSGFPQDAFEVALAGDDLKNSEDATSRAFSQIFGQEKEDFSDDEIRFALLALASGYDLESLRGQISTSLFIFLQTNAEKLSAKEALAALQKHFGVFADEIEEESAAPAVFGASLINFPRISRKSRYLPKFAPLSSLRPAADK